ncbi:uncharacterized protein LOC112082032 [Eutrema salsugineum]|uniref:uncharacterized protein LOC112082032 n=1 Tax=Eutrema salsugineum TaxID=72664 RepID=UPI000CED6A41|nr:uncharacterized protein LOC112082032 [Eutrema salsugineum]
MLFWIRIDGIPPHYQKEETVKGISEKLGDLIEWETTSARVRVSVECEIPLQFERRVIFYTGDEVIVTFRYEKLQKFCFICQRLSHDCCHCPDLEEEKCAFKTKHGNKDTNQRQQAILRGEEGPYMKHGKLIWLKENKSPLFVVNSLLKRRTDHVEIKKRRKGKSASDPGKVRYQRSPSPSPIKRSQRNEDKGRALQPPVSTCSQVMDSNSCDLEEVISPMKEMMALKIPIIAESLDERGGRRGRSIKSRLGPRSNVTLQVKKKITRSPTMGLLSKKWSAPSLAEPSKKIVNADLIISQCIENPSSSKPDPSQGKNLEEPKELVVKEKPPAKP